MSMFINGALPQTPLSSSGLTGRSSTPCAFDSIFGAGVYWMPAFAGMTGNAGMTKQNNERRQ
jgi:hypothetical protein